MITAVRQLTLSIGTLAFIYGIILFVLHTSLRRPITRHSFIPRHVILPTTLYATTFFLAQYYTTSAQLKKLLPIQSGLVRSALADMLSQSVGLSITLLSIVAFTVVTIDNLLFLYGGKRIPALISYIITLSLASIAYYTFYVTLSATKGEVTNHARLIFTLFLWLEGALTAIVLMISTLIIVNFIQSKFKKS